MCSPNDLGRVNLDVLGFVRRPAAAVLPSIAQPPEVAAQIDGRDFLFDMLADTWGPSYASYTPAPAANAFGVRSQTSALGRVAAGDASV